MRNVQAYLPSIGGGGGAGTALKTPDGLTDVTKARDFSVVDYGASGSITDYFATVVAATKVVSLKTNTGSAVSSNDFAVGQGVALIGGGAANSLGAPQLTIGGSPACSATSFGTAYTFTVNTGTNILTTSAAPPVSTGDPVRFTTSNTLPAPAAVLTTYYLARITATTFRVYNSQANAITDDGSTGIIDFSDTGTGTHSVDGYTEYRYTARCGDSTMGFSAASSEIVGRGWVMSPKNTNGIKVRAHVPRGSRSMLIYGRGTSGRKPLFHTEAIGIRGGINSADPENTFSGPVESSGGSTKLRITATAHGFVAGDFVDLQWTSAGDSGFNGQYIVDSVATNTITFAAGTWNAGMTSGSGSLDAAYIEVVDYGDAYELEPYRLNTDVEFANMAWLGRRFLPRGRKVFETANNRWWTQNGYTGSGQSGSSAPSWAATENLQLVDGEQILRRELAAWPTDDTTGATRGVLLTTVQSVDSVSQITLVDAPGADISSNTYCVAHNDGPAFRACVAAARTFGRGANVIIPGGDYYVWMEPLSSGLYTNFLNAAQPFFVYLPLGKGNDYTHPINVIAYGATVRVRQLEPSVRVDHLANGGAIVAPVVGFFGFGSRNSVTLGGTFVYEAFGGISEKNSSGSFEATNFSFYMDKGHLNTTEGIQPYWTISRDQTIHAPSIYYSGGVGSTQPNVGLRRWECHNCHWFYGGGDGNQTGLMWGDFSFVGGSVNCEGPHGSHGFYFNIGKDNYYVDGTTFRWIRTGNKYIIQCRGSNGDEVIRNLRFSNIQAEYCQPLLIGDQTSANGIRNVTLNNIQGCPIILAETIGATVSNCVVPYLTVHEDVDGLKIDNLICKSLILSPADVGRNVQVSKVSASSLVSLDNLELSSLTGLTMREPFSAETSYCNGTWEWITTGLADSSYYLRRRSTGGDPGISAPTQVKVRRKQTRVQGLLDQLGADRWYYGNIEVQTIAISGSPTGGTFTVTYNGNTSGAIAAGATAATMQTALRLVAGLSLVTVTTTGSGNNLTYRVAMTGVVGDPPQMTSSSSLTGGTPVITHATILAYPGYDTLVVRSGDSANLDPDALPLDSVAVQDVVSGDCGFNPGAGLIDCDFRDVKLTRYDGLTAPLVNGGGGSAIGYTRVKFEKFRIRTHGQATTHRVVDFGSFLNDLIDCEFNDWLIQKPGSYVTTNVNTAIRLTMSSGSTVRFRDFYAPFNGGTGGSTAYVFDVSGGRVELINVAIQDNISYMDFDTTANTATFSSSAETGTCQAGSTENTCVLAATASSIDGRYKGRDIVVNNNGVIEVRRVKAYNGTTKTITIHGEWSNTGLPNTLATYEIPTYQCIDLVPIDNFPVIFWFQGVTPPGGLVEGGMYWLKNTTNSAIYPTYADAVAGTNAIDLTGTNCTARAEFPGLANASLYSGAAPMRFTNIAYAKNVRLRGSANWQYAQIASNQNNFQLAPVDMHLFTTDASREITGFAGGWPGREILAFNAGAQDLVIAHQDTGSSAGQRFTGPGAADVTIQAGESAKLFLPGGYQVPGWYAQAY